MRKLIFFLIVMTTIILAYVTQIDFADYIEYPVNHSEIDELEFKKACKGTTVFVDGEFIACFDFDNIGGEPGTGSGPVPTINKPWRNINKPWRNIIKKIKQK